MERRNSEGQLILNPGEKFPDPHGMLDAIRDGLRAEKINRSNYHQQVVSSMIELAKNPKTPIEKRVELFKLLQAEFAAPNAAAKKKPIGKKKNAKNNGSGFAGL